MAPEHRALVLLFGGAGFASAAATRVTDPLVPALALDFAADPATVALLATVLALPYGLVQPVLGPVADAWGKQRVVTAGIALQAVFLLASAFAPTLALLFLFRALTGAAGGGVFPVTLAIFGDRVPLAQRQVAISRFLACAIGGQVAGGFLAGLAAPVIGWRGAVGLAGLACLAAAVVLWRARRPEPTAPLSVAGAMKRYRFLLSHPPALALYAAVGLEGLLVFGAFPFWANHLYETGLGGVREAGFALAAFGAGGFLYTALAPRLVARLGPRKMMRLGGGCAGLGMWAMAAAPSGALFVAAGLLLGLGFFMLHNSMQTRVTEISPESRASAVSLHAFHFFMGQALGAVVLGWGRAALGLPATLVLAGIGAAALGLAIASRTPRT